MDDDMLKSIFPDGLHILVVDDDSMFLNLIAVMLSSCHYRVTACNSPISALSVLLKQPDKFDLLLTDLEMPEMGGRELLKIVKKQLGIPVILMSMDARKEVMVEAIQEGACYFLQKPISINSIRNLWTHVLWKRFSEDKKTEGLLGGNGKGKATPVFDSRATSMGIRIDHGSSGGKMKRVQRIEDGTTGSKKPRVIWTPEMNRRFVEAIKHLGIEQAIPSRITKLMNVEGVDRNHVSSRLQKFRIRLKQEQEKLMSYPYWNKFGCTMNPFSQPGNTGIGPSNVSYPSSIPVLMPQAATYPQCVNEPGTGNAALGSVSGIVQPQQLAGCAQDYSNINCFQSRTTSFGATGGGINTGNLFTSPAQNVREENTIPISEFASVNNNLRAPETSTSDRLAAGGLDSSEILMVSNQSLTTNMGQENPGVRVVASSSGTAEEDDIEKFLEEFFKEDGW